MLDQTDRLLFEGSGTVGHRHCLILVKNKHKYRDNKYCMLICYCFLNRRTYCIAKVVYSEINIGLLMLSLNEYRFNNNHDFTSSLTLLSGIMELLVSENSAVVHTAVWGSLVHPQALIWTHTNRFKDNIVFIQA